MLCTKRLGLAGILATAALGCSDNQLGSLVDGVFTEAEWEKIQTLSPLPEIPADPTNAVADDPDAATLGQMLYFDKAFSQALKIDSDLGSVGEEGKINCADCHGPTWYDDKRSTPNATSIGVDRGSRNSPTVVNVVFYEWFYWDGRADTMWGQALAAAESGVQQQTTRLHTAHVLYAKYKDEYNAVFDPDLDDALDPTSPDAARFPLQGRPKAAGAPDGAWEGMTPEDQDHVNRIMANFGKLLAAYERLLVSRNAPFDQYVAGDTDAMSASAKRGLKSFVSKAGCVECHASPIFTDQGFHNIGVPQVGEFVREEELGRFMAVEQALNNPFNSNGVYSDDTSTGKLDGLEQTEELRGAFRTKHLRQIAATGPYMHTGHLDSLRAVVEFYNDGGVDSGFVGTKDERILPLNLSSAEIDDLVAFLEALTGDEVPSGLQQDTSR